MPASFSGSLNANEIFAALYNMIISQTVFSDNIKGTYGALVDKFKTDGSLYGDMKLYYETDCLTSSEWTNDSEAANLLALNRPKAPDCQKIVIDQFRKVWVTVDNYLSKRAWSTPDAFSQFNNVTISWLKDTKRVYESRLINTYIGTTISAATKAVVNVDIDAGNQTEGQNVAEAIANLLVDLNDTTRDFNDLKYLRSCANSDLVAVWNAKHVNKIKKIDLPTLYKDLSIDKFEQIVLPARYYGTVVTNTNKDTYADNTPAAGKPFDKDGSYAYTPGASNANGTVRSLIECDIKVSSVDYHLFPGDEIPTGTTFSTTATLASGVMAWGTVYIEQNDIIVKIMDNRSVPFMGAFQTETSFFNPRSLTESKYLIWGYSKPDYLKGKPFITVKAV